MSINPPRSQIKSSAVIFDTVIVKRVTGMTSYRFITVNRGPVTVLDR
jgi:hypothetical protein